MPCRTCGCATTPFNTMSSGSPTLCDSCHQQELIGSDDPFGFGGGRARSGGSPLSDPGLSLLGLPPPSKDTPMFHGPLPPPPPDDEPDEVHHGPLPPPPAPDPAPLMTARELVRRARIPFEGKVARFFVNDPFKWGFWKPLSLLLLEYEYARVIDAFGADCNRMRLVLGVLEQIQEVYRAHKDSLEDHQREVLAQLQEQSKGEIGAERAHFMAVSTHSQFSDEEREAMRRLPDKTWAVMVAKKMRKQDYPPHLQVSRDAWWYSEAGLTVLTYGRGATAFIALVGKLTQVANFCGPVAVALAPIQMLFDAKHHFDESSGIEQLGKIVAAKTESVLDRPADIQRQMLEDALELDAGSFAKSWGGAIDWKEVSEVKDRVRAKKDEKKRRRYRLFTGLIGGIAAGAAIVFTGGAAAIVVFGVGVAAAVGGGAATAKSFWEWASEFEKRFAVAECLLESARQGDMTAIGVLESFELIRSPRDLAWLHFSDAFFAVQYKLAEKLGGAL